MPSAQRPAPATRTGVRPMGAAERRSGSLTLAVRISPRSCQLCIRSASYPSAVDAERLKGLQQLAGAAVLGWTDDALLLQQVDQAGGSRVADAEPPLEQRGRDLPVLDRHRYRLLVQVVAVVLLGGV